MVVQKFTSYDLIVDIIPGLLAVFLTALLLPTGLEIGFTNSNPILTGGAVFVLSYFVGRLFHGLGSVVDDSLVGEFLSNSRKIELMEQENGEASIPGVSERVLSEVIEALHSRMGGERSSKAMKHYGENLLYEENVLYSKYEILTTFFRSIWIIFVFYSFIFIFYPYIRSGFNFVFQGLYANPGVLTSVTALPGIYPLFGITFALLAGFFINQWRTFQKRRDRAFVNDLHLHLTENAVQRQTRLSEYDQID